MLYIQWAYAVAIYYINYEKRSGTFALLIMYSKIILHWHWYWNVYAFFFFTYFLSDNLQISIHQLYTLIYIYIYIYITHYVYYNIKYATKYCEYACMFYTVDLSQLPHFIYLRVCHCSSIWREKEMYYQTSKTVALHCWQKGPSEVVEQCLCAQSSRPYSLPCAGGGGEGCLHPWPD